VPNLIDHAFFVVLAVLFPLRAGTFGFRRIQLASPADRPRVRLSVYRQAMVIQWGLAIAALGLWVAFRREWDGIGLVPRLGWGLGGAIFGMVVVAVAVLRQRRHVMSDDEALARLRGRMSRIALMLPHSREELALFFQLSLTAGICEELLYRGYVIWYLSHWLPIFSAAALSALVFGVGHVYQGWRGMLTTGMVGAFLAAVYIVTGSLYVGMILHALMDAHSGQLMQVAYAREQALAAAAFPAPGAGESPT
jgi:hypothetical protein